MPAGWHSVITMPRIWLAAALVGCALFAGGVALFSMDPLHRLWGTCAACAYALAALAVMAWRSRSTAGVDVALGILVCGAILVPLLWLIWTGHGEPEVGVVASSAKTLIKHGTPYKSSKVLATTTNPNAYNPYLPLMAAFGVPQALLGRSTLTDPRVWFGIVFLVVFAFALRIAGARDCVRWAVLVTASPIIAFELCVGGTDVPMVAFLCLGFALLWRVGGTSVIAAGLALGIASSMKATAWPALVVAFALLYVRDGKREAWRFTAVALAVVAVIVGPFAVLRPGSLVKNTILFPLGLASVKSQAASPLLGHVLAQTGAVGHTIVILLLIGSGLAIAVSLVVSPPADVPAATVRLVIGLSAMFVLAPSTRFGYFIYPAAMMLWLFVSLAGRRSAEPAQPAAAAPALPAAAPSPLRPPAAPTRPAVAGTGPRVGSVRREPHASGVTEVDEETMPLRVVGAGTARQAGRLPGWLFGAITVVPAMLAAAWLLPALPLLLTGRFSALPMVLMFAPLAAGLCYLAVRQLPVSWPGFRPGRPARPAVPWWALASTVAVAVIFAVWQIAVRTQQIIFLRDPATYLQVGYWIAHHGSLPIPDSLAAFGGPHAGLGFASVNYYPRGSGIVPQFMTGMPAVLAAAIWLGGVPAALLATPLIGACAVLSFGGLAGRLVGARWAPAAAAVLAVSLPEQYTSRSTFSEPLAQVLLFGGLCLLADSLVVAREPYGEPAAGRAGWPGQDAVLAGLGGLALGLTIFVRIDGLSDILPAVPFLGVLLAARRRQAIPFGVGLVIGVGYGLADGYLLSRPYLDLEAPSLRPLALITVAVVLLTLAGVAVTRSRAALARLSRWLAARWVRWLPEVAAALTILIFVGFAVRPLVQTVAGETDPTSIAYVAELQKLAHLPIDGRRQYYEDSLYWVIWYVGVPTVLLGAFGLAVLARRCLRAFVTWADPDAAARVWALPLMIAIWVIVTVLWRPAVSPDQPWASRRLVPFVLPGLILGAVWASAWLKDRAGLLGRGRVTSAAVASCCAAALLLPTALTNLDVGFIRNASGTGRHLGAHGMAFTRIGAGELTAVNGLCAAIGPDASVVILDSLTADRFAQVVRGMCGTPAGVLDHPTPATVGAVVTGIERAGRRPVLLAQTEAELTPYGGTPTEVVNLLTTQEAHNLTSPPTRTWRIHYTVWMSEPAAATAGGPAA